MEIFIVKSLFLLKRSFKNRIVSSDALCLNNSDAPSTYAPFLAECGLVHCDLDRKNDNRNANILHDYLKTMDRLSSWNGNHLSWWATDLSSKNRFKSPLLPLLNIFVQCIRAVEKGYKERKDIILIDIPWPVVKCLQHLAKERMWNLKVLSWPLSSFRQRFTGYFREWWMIFKKAFWAFFDIRKLRQDFGSAYSYLSHVKKPVYLIKSFVYENAFQNGGQYIDPFFGDLAERLLKRFNGKPEVVTVALGFEKKHECYTRFKSLREPIVIPFESTLSKTDVLISLVDLTWHLISKPIKIKGELSFLGYNISPLVREMILSGGWQTQFFQYLHYKAGLNFSKYFPIAVCAITYESNPWEKMFIAGLRKHQPDVSIIGYQHSVIPQSAAGMFLSSEELKKMPIPDKIVTTGSVPKKIMLEYGTTPPELIHPACALRYDYLNQISPIPRRNGKPFRVLVALEGVKEVVPIVKYVLHESGRLKSVQFNIRTHPVLPFGKILESLNWIGKMPENIEFSENKSIYEDVTDSDAVLYWGTTVALEALLMGRPVIHYDRGDIFSYDPLFQLDEFKWRVKDKDNLDSIIGDIEAMSNSRYEGLREMAKKYVQDYFHTVSQEKIKPFVY